MWTEKYNSNDFLSLTVHFIDENWILRKIMLGMEEVEEEKTTVNIRIESKSILKNYFEAADIESVVYISTSTTDGGANMLKVF